MSTVTDFKFYDSRSEYVFRPCSVATSLVNHQNYSYYAVLQCCGEYGVIPYSLLTWAQTTTTTSEYGIIRKPLVATRTNKE